jgi:Tfp pilus assembly protein PilF
MASTARFTPLLAPVLLVAGALVASAAAPARAETPEQLDGLSRATDVPSVGIALARRQINQGDLLGAMATLERVMLNAPDNETARLFHAGLLCRLDDREGSLVEFDDLRGRDYPDALWEEAAAACDRRDRR